MKENDVVLYSAKWCVYCRSLKQKLNIFGVIYQEKNVDDEGIREEMNKKTDNNQTIPVLFIGEKYWVNPSFQTLQEQFK